MNLDAKAAPHSALDSHLLPRRYDTTPAVENKATKTSSMANQAVRTKTMSEARPNATSQKLLPKRRAIHPASRSAAAPAASGGCAKAQLGT
ncbi:MAG: hypothetical protein ABWU84_01585 [Pyrobaculum sp.]|uniref:hypothetical protein n=1 Tax=Pyrobaculum sp. TaxID=2004705 RepID=UPI003EEB8A5A